MEPGPLYYENFGHNAIIIEDRLDLSRPATSYNFGYFDFESKGFLQNFIFGKMQYMGLALDAERDIEAYLKAGRTVWVDELNLSSEQVEKLELILRRETAPPKDVYAYDYFRNNCSTRVRDALNEAFGGALERGLSNRSHGFTYRSLGNAHALSTPWQYLGIHAGLGPSTDRPLSIYQESFIPAALKLALDGLKIPDANGALQPVFSYQQVYGDALKRPALPPAKDLRWWFLLAGLLIAIVIAAGFRFRGIGWLRRLAAVSAVLSSLALGLSGCLLVFLMTATDHQDAFYNLNVLLFCPLALGLAWQLRTSARANWQSASSWISQFMLISVAVCALLKTLPAVKQVNLEWWLLVAPIVLALRFATARVRRNF